jgi:hypothetical protein
MKKHRTLTLILSIFLLIALANVNAEVVIPENLSFSSAIKLSIEQLENSPYKTLEVQTEAGVFSGDYVSKTDEVLILKTKTNSIHMKSGKEKVILTYINISNITAISVFVLGE